MDLFNIGVDPTILRSVLLNRRLKKYPRVLNRPPISQNRIPLKRREVMKAPVSFRKPLRQKALRKPEIPPQLQHELQTSPFPQYCWEISAAKRKRNKKLCKELGDINPYRHPVEGVRHNFRNLVDPVKKLIAKKELELPVAQKYSLKVKRQLKAKNIVNRVYAGTKPVLKFEEKREPVMLQLETSNALEYRLTWKEIELCKIMANLKTAEEKNMDSLLQEEESALKKKEKMLKFEASEMETEISDLEKLLFDDLRQLVHEKEISRQKVTEAEDLIEQMGLVKHQLYLTINKLEEMQKYGQFLYTLSPYEWRLEQQRLGTIELGEIKPYEGEVLDDLEYLHDLALNKIKKPVLYFKSPEHFMELFLELENINFAIYSRTKVITNIAETATNYAKELVRRYELELKILVEMAHELKKEIVWEENQMKLLKNFCSKYLFSDFATLVWELENVKMAVENTYVEVLTTNDLNLGAADLMKQIELQVVHLTESANPSNPETIRLTKQMNQESRLRDIAQRKFEKTFREYEMLLKELRRAYEYEKLVPRRKLMQRSTPMLLQKAEAAESIAEEEEDKEYLTYFGDDAFPCRT